MKRGGKLGLALSGAVLSGAVAVVAPACLAAEPDSPVYTWTGLGGDGLWSNPDNWSCSVEGSAGYPDTAPASAVFGDGATGTVKLDKAYTIGSLELTGEGADIVFASHGPDGAKASLTALFVGGSRNSKWTVDGCTLTSTKLWGWGLDNKPAASNNVLTVTNGGTLLSNGGNFQFVGDDNALVIEKEALLKTNFGTALNFGGNRSRIVVDDATLWSESLLVFTIGYAATAGNRLEIRGSHPAVRVKKSIWGWFNGDVTFSFVVPKGGYEESPIRPSNPGDGALAELFENTKRLVFEVDPSSPALQSAVATSTLLLDWRNMRSKTIDTSGVEFAPAGPAGCGLAWAYGSEASETPKTEGEKPTGVRATLRSASTSLVIRLR